MIILSDQCPFCGSDNTEYLDSHQDVDQTVETFECYNCRKKFGKRYDFATYIDEEDHAIPSWEQMEQARVAMLEKALKEPTDKMVPGRFA